MKSGGRRLFSEMWNRREASGVRSRRHFCLSLIPSLFIGNLLGCSAGFDHHLPHSRLGARVNFCYEGPDGHGGRLRARGHCCPSSAPCGAPHSRTRHRGQTRGNRGQVVWAPEQLTLYLGPLPPLQWSWGNVSAERGRGGKVTDVRSDPARLPSCAPTCCMFSPDGIRRAFLPCALAASSYHQAFYWIRCHDGKSSPGARMPTVGHAPDLHCTLIILFLIITFSDNHSHYTDTSY